MAFPVFLEQIIFFQARKQVKLCEVIYNLPPIIYLTFFGGCLVSNFLVDTFWWISCLAFYLVDTFLAKISLIDWASSKHLMLTPISDSSWGAVNKKQVEMKRLVKNSSTTRTSVLGWLGWIGWLGGWAVLFIKHLDSIFRGENGLTWGQKWPNFGAKRAQLRFPAICSK